MKHKITSLILLTCITHGISQSLNNAEKGLIKANLILPGFGYELGFKENSTLNFELGIIPDWDGEFELFPYLGADYRYFLNFERRLKKGKHIAGNTGNYIAFNNRILFSAPLLGNFEYDNPLLYAGGIVYGIQRTYDSGLYWGTSLGPAFFTGDYNPGFGLLFDLKLGWVLGRSKN